MDTQIHNGISYTPDADQRGYRPPTPTPTFEPPRVTAAAPTGDGTALEQAHAAMVNAHNEFKKHIDATFADRDRYSDQGFREQLAKFSDTRAAAAIDTALANVQAVHDKAQAAVDAMRETFVNPGDAAQESRNVRYWNRTKPVLDSLEPGAVMQEAEKLLAKADRDTLGVLLEELPSYLRLRIGPLDDNTKRNNNLGKDSDWGDWIDAVYLPRAIPEYAEARAKVTKAKAALAFTKQNAHTLHNAFAAGNATAIVLADPFKNKLGNTGQYDPER